MIEPISAKSRQRGFSLAEVLVAVALLAVILLALFGLVTAGVRRAYSGRKMTEASILAQHVMERVNVYQPQEILGGVAANQTVSITWQKTGPADADTTPAATGGVSNAEIERDEIRKLLVDADIPANATNAARLTVRATAVPTAAPLGPKTFANATLVRIVVNLTWVEWGARTRQVQLQAFNLRSTP